MRRTTSRHLGRIAIIAAAMLSLPSCGGPSPYDFPFPIVSQSGGRAYSMRGFVQFTSSRDEAVQTIAGRMAAACGGPASLDLITLVRADSAGGIPHFYYEAIGNCESRSAAR